MKCFYLSQVDLTKNYSGAVHVQESVLGMMQNGLSVTLFCQRSALSSTRGPRPHFENVGSMSGSLFGYLGYQMRLLRRVVALALRERPNFFYVRSEAAMFAHLVASFLSGVPYLLELNSWPYRDYDKVRHVGRLMKIMTRWILSKSIKRSRAVICVTSELACRVRETFHPRGEVVVLENGVNTDLFYPVTNEGPRAHLGLGKNDFVLGYVAYFQYYNDAEIVMHALPALMERIPNLKVVLVGGWAQAAYLGRIEGLLSDKVRSAVQIMGEVPYEQVPMYINAFDLGLATFNSDVGDGSVMKVYEYLACGKPILGSRLGSLAFLEEIGAGKLVGIGSVNEFTRAVLELSLQPSELSRMGSKGLEYVADGHSWTAVNKRLVDVAARLLKGPSGRSFLRQVEPVHKGENR